MPGPQPTTTVKVAGIGAGYFSRFHYAAWQHNPRAELVGVADHDPAKAAATGAAAFADAATLLTELRPDLVDIVTPPDSHLEMISLALDSGAKAIICQKPFCGALDQAERATALAAAAGIPLIVHENFRWQPWYRRLRREIEAGLIGDVQQITFRLRPGDGQGPEAYLDRQPYFQTMPRFLIHETAIHWIDTFRFLLGEPEAVYAELRRLNPAIAGEDAGFFLYSYADGRRALFDGNRLLDHPAEDRRRTMGEGSIEGNDGEIRLSGDGSLQFRARGENDWRLVADAPTDPGFGGGCVGALQDHVLDALLEGGALENEASDYLPNMRIELSIYESAESGRRIDLIS